MKYGKKILPVLVLFSFWTIAIQAQETISATGGNATGIGGSVSYTVGQIAYSALSGSNGTVNQGVQQPYEITVVTAIENISAINLSCIIYPNPTRGVVKLVFESFDNEEMRFRLFDLNGLLLQDKKIESIETEISMENLSSSVYFLRVIKNNKELKTFKIVKK
jgi:hypothetical protein